MSGDAIGRGAEQVVAEDVAAMAEDDQVMTVCTGVHAEPELHGLAGKFNEAHPDPKT